MANMSYCRFHNTWADLKDCYQHISEKVEGDAEEEAARKRIISLCHRIAEENQDE